MTDIVERLRTPASHLRMVKGDDGYETAYCPRCQDAAAEIERLRAALREVLEDYESYEFWTDGHGGYSKPVHNPEILRRARAALESK